MNPKYQKIADKIVYEGNASKISKIRKGIAQSELIFNTHLEALQSLGIVDENIEQKGTLLNASKEINSLDINDVQKQALMTEAANIKEAKKKIEVHKQIADELERKNNE